MIRQVNGEVKAYFIVRGKDFWTTTLNGHNVFTQLLQKVLISYYFLHTLKNMKKRNWGVCYIIKICLD